MKIFAANKSLKNFALVNSISVWQILFPDFMIICQKIGETKINLNKSG